MYNYMINIKKDKRGSWVKYKGRKINIPKYLLSKDAPQKEILKWLVKKLVKLRKKRQKPKQSKTKPIEKSIPGDQSRPTTVNEKLNKYKVKLLINN